MRHRYVNSSGITLIELIIVIALLCVIVLAFRSCGGSAVKTATSKIISFFDQPVSKSKDGFEASLWSLNSPKANGAPLFSNPSKKSSIVRRVQRFEGYSRSGKVTNEFIEVKMESDHAVGWLEKDIIGAPGGVMRILWIGTKAFLSPMLNLKTILDVFLGVLITFVIIKIFGHNMGGIISQKIDLATIAVSAITTIVMQGITRKFIPVSLEVEQMELGFAWGALMVQGAFPVIIAAVISNHLFGRSYDRPSVIENFFGISTFFMMYLAWGYGAGWWI